MTKTKQQRILALLEDFDEAAQCHGWEQYQGSQKDTDETRIKYNAAKYALITEITE